MTIRPPPLAMHAWKLSSLSSAIALSSWSTYVSALVAGTSLPSSSTCANTLFIPARFAPFINDMNVEKLTAQLDLAQRQIEQNGSARIIFFDLCLQLIVLIK